MGILSGPKPQMLDVRHGGSTPTVARRAGVGVGPQPAAGERPLANRARSANRGEVVARRPSLHPATHRGPGDHARRGHTPARPARGPSMSLATPDHRRARSDHGRRRVATQTNARVATGHLPGHQADRPTHPHPATRPGSTGLSANASAVTANRRIAPTTRGHGHWRHRQQQPPSARRALHPDSAGCRETLAGSRRRCTSVSGRLTLSPGLTAWLGDLQGRRPKHPGDDQGVHATGNVTHTAPQVLRTGRSRDHRPGVLTRATSTPPGHSDSRQRMVLRTL
jgi:hypothetical protein